MRLGSQWERFRKKEWCVLVTWKLELFGPTRSTAIRRISPAAAGADKCSVSWLRETDLSPVGGFGTPGVEVSERTDVVKGSPKGRVAVVIADEVSERRRTW